VGLLTNYQTEKIKEVRFVSVDDDGVQKLKLILYPIDAPHIEIEFANKVDLDGLFVSVIDFVAAINTLTADINEHIASSHSHPDLATHLALGLDASD
jgi:hypothetical protein